MKDLIHNCIFCVKKIERIEGMNSDMDWEGMWLDGIVEKVTAGYGSRLDGESYLIAICDDCLLKYGKPIIKDENRTTNR